MPEIDVDVASQRAAILENALAAFVAELRLVDPGDMIGYIRAGQWGNIADLVQSSAELHFRNDTLVFACAGDFALDWASAPSIRLEMEFQSNAVTLFFTLILNRVEGAVLLHDVWFPSEPESAAEGTRAIERAVADARRPLRVAATRHARRA